MIIVGWSQGSRSLALSNMAFFSVYLGISRVAACRDPIDRIAEITCPQAQSLNPVGIV
jgi:hypothetical protein